MRNSRAAFGLAAVFGDAGRERRHRRAFRREEDLHRRAVAQLREDRVVEQRRDRDLAAHQRVGGRRVGGKQHRLGRRLLLPVVLGHHLALEHRARPGRAAGRREHVADLLAAVFRLGQIHPGLRRILHQLGIVGDRPDRRWSAATASARRAFPGCSPRHSAARSRRTDSRSRASASGRNGRSTSASKLSGRRLGLHALEQLIARRAQKLDLDEGKALVERVDDRRLRLGDVRAVEDELAFLAALDQLRMLVGRCGARRPMIAKLPMPAATREACAGQSLPMRRENRLIARECSLAIPVNLVPFLDPFAVAASRTPRTSAPTPSCPWSCPRAAAAALSAM